MSTLIVDERMDRYSKRIMMIEFFGFVTSREKQMLNLRFAALVASNKSVHIKLICFVKTTI